MKSEPGSAVPLWRAFVLLYGARPACRYQVEPDPAEQAQRHCAEATVIDWHARLVCSNCGSREIDMVVTGTKRGA